MKKKNDNGSAEELVIQYLKKNKNFFINYPKLLDILNLPTTIKSSNKIIDLNAYRSKKIKEDSDKLKKQISQRNELCNIHDWRLAEGVLCF